MVMAYETLKTPIQITMVCLCLVSVCFGCRLQIVGSVGTQSDCVPCCVYLQFRKQTCLNVSKRLVVMFRSWRFIQEKACRHAVEKRHYVSSYNNTLTASNLTLYSISEHVEKFYSSPNVLSPQLCLHACCYSQMCICELIYIRAGILDEIECPSNSSSFMSCPDSGEKAWFPTFNYTQNNTSTHIHRCELLEPIEATLITATKRLKIQNDKTRIRLDNVSSSQSYLRK